MTARNWLCTLNNPVASDMGLYLKELHELTGAVYTAGQLEKGLKEGTPHLQFTMNFPRQVRMAHITKVVQCHCVAIKVDNGVDTYCMKEETRVDGPWTFGQRPIKNTKTDWKIVWDLAVANRIDEIPHQVRLAHYHKLKSIAKDHMVLPPPSNQTKGIWIYGPSGVGKSVLARSGDPFFYPKLCNKWWDGYAGQKTVIMDDIGKDHECLQQQLKIWADHHSCILETKGGALTSVYDKFIVTSQYSIDEIFSDPCTREALHRRYKVVHMLDKSLNLGKNHLEEIATQRPSWNVRHLDPTPYDLGKRANPDEQTEQ